MFRTQRKCYNPQWIEPRISPSCLADIANALPGVFGSVDALAVQACVLRGSASLTHHLSAMRRVLDKVEGFFNTSYQVVLRVCSIFIFS